MAVNRQSNVQRNASFRRIAIVLSSLPAASAAKLLGTMPAADKSQLRRVMATLSDVDPLERQRALQSFTSTLQKNHGIAGEPTSGSADEIHFSRVSVDSRNAGSRFASEFAGGPQASDADAASTDDSPLGFVHGVSDADLAAVLSSERPQTLAIVLASISPVKAARVLPLLDKTLRMDTITRIGRLGEIPADAVVELAAHLKERLESTSSDQSNSSGQRALNAILAELPRADRETPAEPGTRSDSESGVAEALRTETVSAVQDEFVPSSGRDEFVSVSPRTPSSPGPVTNPASGDEIRLAPHTAGPVDSEHEHVGPTTSMSTDDIQACLIGLSPVDLCQALGRVETQTAILAICGLPTDVTDAALALLPKLAARDVRRQLLNVGAIDLREIDDAKSIVAAAALHPHADRPNDAAAANRRSQPVAEPSHRRQLPVAA